MSDLAYRVVKEMVGGDKVVRAYKDLYGRLQFATTDDVMLDPESDPRFEFLRAHHQDNETMDWVGYTYEGSLNDLVRKSIGGSWS